MVINGNQEDRQPIVDDDLCVKNCDSYTYLGAVFTQDGSPSTSVKEHMAAKRSHIMKFVSFLGKNCDFPFWVKWKVMASALLSAILYGCEGWILNSTVVAQNCESPAWSKNIHPEWYLPYWTGDTICHCPGESCIAEVYSQAHSGAPGTNWRPFHGCVEPLQ